MKKIKFITAEINDSNTNNVLINTILFKNGDYVQKDQIIFEVETSKKNIEIQTLESGYFYTNIKVGDVVPSSFNLGLISSELILENEIDLKNEVSKSVADLDMSAKAKKVLLKFGLNPQNLNSKLKNYSDVENYLVNELGISVTKSTNVQRVREESIASNTFVSNISMAFSEKKLIEKIKKLEDELKLKISVESVFIFIVHKALKKYPLLSSYLENEEHIIYNKYPVGIYIASEEQSGVPYSIMGHDCENFSTILESLFEIQKAYIAGGLVGNSHSCFYISNLYNTDVLNFFPLLKTKSAATLGIASPFLDTYSVSLSFDHRLLDGQYAVSFLKTLKNELELL